MQSKPILLFGSSGHASVIADIVEKIGALRIAGLIDSFTGPGSIRFGYPVLGPESELPRIVQATSAEALIVAVGDNHLRTRLVESVRSILPWLPFETAIHPSASIARGVSIGPGTVIMAGAVVNSNASIGSHCILNTLSSLDHDSRMDDFSSLGPGAHTGGNCRLRLGAVLAQGAHLIHGRSIGEHSVAGAGATVLNDIPDRCVAFGTPARVIRSRQPGDKYL
jgi:sugar O-acyltransferase (sialic acid O-acetyltransferase NeuD family)